MSSTRSLRLPIFVAASLAVGAAVVRAEDHPLNQHPAVIMHARAATIDPNTFIVAPPTSTTWTQHHANGEHPAVIVARMASHTGIDSNRFTVQPPASVTWTLGSDEQLAASTAAERTALLTR